MACRRWLSLNFIVRAKFVSHRMTLSKGRWPYSGHVAVFLISVALAITVLALVISIPSHSENIISYLALWGGTSVFLAYLFGQTIRLGPILKLPPTNHFHFIGGLLAVAAIYAFVEEGMHAFIG